MSASDTSAVKPICLKLDVVHAQQERRLRADGLSKVAQMRAVGRPHLHQARAALAQHIGDAKAAADLHELAARDDHLRPRARADRTRNTAPALLLTTSAASAPVSRQSSCSAWTVARAALARVQVIFQVAVAGRHGFHGLPCGSLNGARPRLVWMITPVALMTGRSVPRRPPPAGARPPAPARP